MKAKKYAGLLLSILLLMSMLTGSAETYGDLDARFSDVSKLEYNDVTYYMNNRMTTVLVMCAAKNAENDAVMDAPQLIVFLVIDDDAKYVYPLMLDRNTVQDWVEDETAGVSLAESFALGEDVEAGSLALVEVVNGLFPEPVIEHYAVFDAAGLTVLDGIENNEENIVQDVLLDRMRAVKAEYEAMPMADYQDLFSEMSDYITTDMKSGAMMKVIDKCDRYDRDHLAPLPMVEDEAGTVCIDKELLLQKIVDIYYNDEPLW